jgi:hypothetical protein
MRATPPLKSQMQCDGAGTCASVCNVGATCVPFCGGTCELSGAACVCAP